MLRCRRCSLVQILPRQPSVEYGKDYFDSYQDFEERTIRHSARVSLFRQKLREIGRHINTGRLLDVGCAKGDFLHLARDEFGWNVVGLDISEWAARYARSVYGLDVQVAAASGAVFRQGEFDVIHASHVLEHTYAPLTALQKLWMWLKPGGYLHIEVPNETDNLTWYVGCFCQSKTRRCTSRSYPY
jgi:2-polyprenyl-3-methyl-5-hydroxy-6-metoxy-1,4-benzoquinol methylase